MVASPRPTVVEPQINRLHGDLQNPMKITNNKGVIYGHPHTWHGKSSWTEEETPSSGLEDTPAGTNLSPGKTAIPSQISQETPETQKHDDATAMTNDTKLSQC
jgi:hypothetical protein